MRILVLIHEYPPVGGGGGRVAQDICEGLVKQGHEVLILTAHCEDLPFEEHQDGIIIQRLKSWRRLPYKADIRAMAGYVWKSFWVGLKIIQEWHPDVIHTHFAVPAGASAWLLNRLTGIPYVLTAHLGDVPGGTPEKTGKWFKWVFPFTPPIWKRAAQVVAVSEFTRQLALRSYSVDVRVIPNGVDLEKINPGNIGLHTPPRIVFAGRFMKQKNPIQIIRTLSSLKDLPWNCVLIGDGPLREEIEREIKNHELKSRITLTGWIKPEQVLDWYARSDIMFMPSLSEGLPVVGVQGLAMGLALVLSCAGGNVELIQNGENGYLIEVDDVLKYETSLRTLLSDPEACLAARIASRRIARRFDIHSIVESYANIFNQAVNSNPD